MESRGQRVPFVVITGHGSESVAVRMMKYGAYDYVIKDAAFLMLLPAVIDRALDRVRQDERLAEAEEQLRRAHDDLERRVEQRTIELGEANRRLRVEIDQRRDAEHRAQQHLAELAHVARLSTVGETVAELAHELSQPLGAICSYAQACQRLLVAAGYDNCEELATSLHQVNEQGTRAAEIIRRLRRFVSKSRPLMASIHLNAVIRSVVELMNAEARSAEAEVVLQLDDAIPPVVADQIQVEQVLVNLMRNALESLRLSDMPRRLVVRTALNDACCVTVDVADNGLGIAADAADRLFERFFTTKPDGMGMGLCVSRSIIESHGGKLWAAPASDGGAVFHFTLRIHNGDHNRGSRTHHLHCG
jgi:two-component system, LuxR family, sensor histidine kinase TtrS